jgi:hypothetical protein
LPIQAILFKWSLLNSCTKNVTKDIPGLECDLNSIYTNEDMLYCLQDELKTIQVTCV